MSAMEYVRAARLLAHTLRAYAVELAPLVADLADALLDVLQVSLRLIAALVRPAAALVRAAAAAARPPLAAVAAAAWRLFRRQSPEALALEAAAACVVAVCGVFEVRYGLVRGVWRLGKGSVRRVGAWYGGVRRGVREKSRVAAMLMSHVVFVVPVVAGSLWAGGGLGRFVRGYGMTIVSCGVPVWRTVAVLYRMDGEGGQGEGDCSSGSGEEEEEAGVEGVDDTAAQRDPGARVLNSQVAKGATRRSLRNRRPSQTQSPSSSSPSPVKHTQLALRPKRTTPPPPTRPTRSSKSLERASREREASLLRFWAVFGVLWAARGGLRYFSPAMLAPLHDRTDTPVFFLLVWMQLGLTRGADVLFPILAAALRQKAHLRDNATAGAERFTLGIRFFVSTGYLSPHRAAAISSNISESSVVLVGSIFFLTPRPATYVGTLLTAYLVPVYLTVYAATPASLLSTRQTWLTYWASCAVIEALYSYFSALDWVPLWYHAKLALILWLQVPYYRGAASLLDGAMAHWATILSNVRGKPVTPRKRTS